MAQILQIPVPDPDDQDLEYPLLQPVAVDQEHEGLALFRIGMPLALQNVLITITSTICVIMVGNTSSQSSLNLDASSLAVMYSNISGLSIGLGMTYGLDTLYANANGCKAGGDHRLAALYTQRCFVILAIACIPIAIFNILTKPFLVYVLQQPVDMSIGAAEFAHRLLPGLPFIFINTVMSKSLQSRSAVMPTVVIGLFSNFFNLALCYAFLNVLHLEFFFAAWSRTIASVIAPILTLAYFSYAGLLDLLWRPWNTSLVCEPAALWRFFCLSFHSFVMIVGEWWAFEFTYVMTGWLPDPDTAVAAHTILFTINVVKYVGYGGIASATSIRIGNHLSQSKDSAAKTSAAISTISSLLIAVLLIIASTLTIRPMAMLYTHETDVVDLAVSCIIPVGVSELGYALLMTSGGILRGCGYQRVGSLFIVVGYLLGLPLAFILSRRIGLVGIWWGNACALVFSAIASLVYIFFLDWGKAVEMTLLRLKADNVRDSSEECDQEEEYDSLSESPSNCDYQSIGACVAC